MQTSRVTPSERFTSLDGKGIPVTTMAEGTEENKIRKGLSLVFR